MLPAKKDNVVMALPDSQSGKLPKIVFNDKNLPDITKEAFDALTKANNPPFLFRYGNSIVRLVTGENDQILVDVLDRNKMTYEATRAAVFGMNGRNGFKIHPPPAYVVYDMLSEPEPPLPVLRRIVNAPIFSTDGKLQTSPGYCLTTKYYLNYNDASVIRDVPTVFQIRILCTQKESLMNCLSISPLSVNLKKRMQCVYFCRRLSVR